MGMTTRAFGALTLSGLALLAGCYNEPAKLAPAEKVAPTQVLNASALRDKLVSVYPYMVAKDEIRSKVVGLEGCRLFGISAAESAYREKKATVTCTTEDNKLAAQLMCMPTASGGGCLPDGHVARPE